jgi:hypothetical protein
LIDPSVLRAAKENQFEFIQISMPLPPLKPMAQSWRGVGITEAQVRPLVAPVPPQSESPHAVIDPSALRAAKAYLVE